MMKISFSRLRASVDKSSSKQGSESCGSCSGRTQSMSNVHHFEGVHGRSLSGIMLNSSSISGVERCCRSASSRSIVNLCKTNLETGCRMCGGSRNVVQTQRSFLHVMRCKISKKFRQASNEKDLCCHGDSGEGSWLLPNTRMVSESQCSQGFVRQRSSKKSSAANSVYPVELSSAPRDPSECLRMLGSTCPRSSQQEGAQPCQAEAAHCIRGDGTQSFYQQVKVDIPDPHTRPSLDWSLAQELQNLVGYGWYWGPISRVEAEELLTGKPDGAFLVRDSSDDHYVLSLSFRSCGKTKHTRIQHCNNMFSFYVCSASDLDCFPSIPDLIKHSMEQSEGGVLCYGKDSLESTRVLPVRLMRPLSRLERVRSLQSLCRFVIRQSVRLDRVQQLPLPQTVKTFIEEKLF